ncbi:M14 family metallopeptidase [Paenibacillus pini]|uniref:Gamma-D-glutamyl-L-diamino acid endopeptidase n=1 Tax=Paenibacillus pini JCM 16418 TaxID=1236976 RepID=W7YVN1_9BACL|nr:M14 family metallopeptidase [Paenibacillus pini]GAF06454.1 gamma-D-glutamyl-L-diamino acid endopeptidase [Paenibacillus pini JCM 16418]
MQQHTVRKGDTLQRIAANKGLAINTILSANPWAALQPYLIPGQMLYLPFSPRRRYAIQPGDTMNRLKNMFHISEKALEDMNPGISSSHLPEGRTIVLPTSNPRHVVELRGEYGADQVCTDIEKLATNYPTVEIGTIGKSVMGKPIWFIKIGKGSRCIHVNASLHANEWLTTPCAVRFVEEYAAALQNSAKWHGYDPQRWFEECTLWVVPMVNPDGVELVQEGIVPGHPYYDQLQEWNGSKLDFRNWKANIHGVDLGDQFPAHWDEELLRRGKPTPSPRDYGGTAPLCEPESAALAAFTLETAPDAVISLHSQGQEIYWNYRDYEPEESIEWARRLGQASGYRPVKLNGSDAGYKDWFIQHFRKPGFTVEIGMGKNPLPLEDFEQVSEDVGLIIAELLSI